MSDEAEERPPKRLRASSPDSKGHFSTHDTSHHEDGGKDVQDRKITTATPTTGMLHVDHPAPQPQIQPTNTDTDQVQPQPPHKTPSQDPDETHQKEIEVGITHFITPDSLSLPDTPSKFQRSEQTPQSPPRFRAIFKKRYTDFLVREIGLDGQIVRLKELKYFPAGSVSLENGNENEEQSASGALAIGTGTGLENAGKVGDRAGNETKRDEGGTKKSVGSVDEGHGHELEQRQNQGQVQERGEGEGSVEVGLKKGIRMADGNGGASKEELVSTQKNDSLPADTMAGTSSVSKENTNQNPIEDSEQKTTQIQDPNQDESQKQHPHAEISREDQNLLISYLNAEAVDQILALYRSIINHPSRRPRDHDTVRTEFTSDRTIRSQIHQSIRRIFEGKIESQTDNDGILVLTASQQSQFQRTQNQNKSKSKSTGGSRQPGRHGKLAWSDRGGEYLHFTLYKENKDTMEVTSYLARMLQTTPKTFQFAGTKDRRAVTTQRLSAFRVDADRLAGLNRSLRNAAVGDFLYCTNGLELGDLSGNEFVLTLRECDFERGSMGSAGERLVAIEEYLKNGLTNLHQRGFLNYFGLQRFGSFATRTDVTGMKILQGDFQGACETLLEYPEETLAAALDIETGSDFSSDDRARAQALHLWSTNKNPNKALAMLPRKFTAEACVIRHLSRYPTDFVQALLSIPRNLRLMYVHAYQSLVWNLAVGKRWELYGEQVVKGDLVLMNEHKDKQVKEEKVEIDTDGEIIIQATEEDRAQTADDIFERARPLSADEAASGAYSIFDVVLPTPGFDILYPINESGEFYGTFMKSELGGGLNPHDMRRKQKDFSLSGSYRKMIARIGADYEVKAYRHSDENQQFVQTDMDILQRDEKRKETEDTEMKVVVDGQPVQQSGDTVSVVIKFQLGSSQYATMALRELSRGGIQPYKPEFGGRR